MLWLFKKRWTVQTFSTKLQAFLKVVNPPKVKGELEVVSAISKWEAEVLALRKRFAAELDESLRIAILLSMLPTDMQDDLYRKGHVRESMSYDEVREHLLTVSNAKAQFGKPTPLNVGNARGM